MNGDGLGQRFHSVKTKLSTVERGREFGGWTTQVIDDSLGHRGTTIRVDCLSVFMATSCLFRLSGTHSTHTHISPMWLRTTSINTTYRVTAENRA